MIEQNKITGTDMEKREFQGYDYFISVNEGKRINNLKRKERHKNCLLLAVFVLFVVFLIILEWILFYYQDLLIIPNSIPDYYSDVLYVICICSIIYSIITYEKICMKCSSDYDQKHRIYWWGIFSAATTAVSVFVILHQYICSVFGYEDCAVLSLKIELITTSSALVISCIGRKKRIQRLRGFAFLPV